MRSLLVKLGIISPRIIVVNAETVDVEKLKSNLDASFVIVDIQVSIAPYEV